MSCSTNINIAAVSQAPCCSWKVTRTYDCNSPLYRLYPDGVQEVKLFAPVRIHRFEDTFMLQDKQSSFYVNYQQENIAIEGQALDTEAVGLEDFEQYLHELLCCASSDDEDAACGNFVLMAEEVNVACSNDVATFQIIITHQSGGYIPAGTVFNLAWVGIGSNPAFSTTGSGATIATDGTTLQITEDWLENNAIQFNVSFDNVGCAPGIYTVVISPTACYTMTPNPFVISYNYS